ncbi:MAG TPA: secondary thiamine-phosphate synthase enzyme YjbQ [Candidatus Sumerlaeota bacterium]|nr:secondary thiamine-phosphate synthase enzyme YjbQ [Candidatus Sumerlaeota bacterium]
MPTYRKELHFCTTRACEILNITDQVEGAVAESSIQEGMALVYPMHTSSAVYVSDSDYSLTQDFADLLDELVPASREYRHDRTDYKKNAAGHLKAILSGHSVTLPVTAGRLDLGTYQTLYYFEFDGKRPKEVLVKILGDRESGEIRP